MMIEKFEVFKDSIYFLYLKTLQLLVIIEALEHTYILVIVVGKNGLKSFIKKFHNILF